MYCVPCKRTVLNFTRHLLAKQVIGFHQDNEHLRELINLHNEEKSQEFRSALKALKANWNQKNPGIKQSSRANRLCNKGCGMAVTLSYQQRHNRICRKITTIEISELDVGFELQTYMKDRMHDEVFLQIISDENLLYYLRFHFSPGATEKGKQNFWEMVRMLARFKMAANNEANKSLSLNSILVTKDSQEIIEIALKSDIKNQTKLGTALGKLIKSECDRIDGLLLTRKFLRQKLLLEKAALNRHEQAFQKQWSLKVNKQVWYNKRQTDVNKIKDVPSAQEKSNQLDKIYKEMAECINKLKMKKTPEELMKLKNFILAYLVIDSGRRGSDLSSLKTKDYFIQKSKREMAENGTDWICLTVGKNFDMNPVFINKWTEEAIEMVIECNELLESEENRLYIFHKYGAKRDTVVRAWDAKHWISKRYKMKLHTAANYRSLYAQQSQQKGLSTFESRSMLKVLAHGGDAHERHYQARQRGTLRDVMKKFSHKPASEDFQEDQEVDSAENEILREQQVASQSDVSEFSFEQIIPDEDQQQSKEESDGQRYLVEIHCDIKDVKEFSSNAPEILSEQVASDVADFELNKTDENQQSMDEVPFDEPSRCEKAAVLHVKWVADEEIPKIMDKGEIDVLQSARSGNNYSDRSMRMEQRYVYVCVMCNECM